MTLLPLLISCEKDDPETPVDTCANTDYTYPLDMKVIFDTNCASASCHDGNNSLADYSTYNGVFADRIKLQNGINQGLEQVTNEGLN